MLLFVTHVLYLNISLPQLIDFFTENKLRCLSDSYCQNGNKCIRMIFF